MILTRDNYYSREANEAYWSASFVKDMLDCPARAMAVLRGEYEKPPTTALLVGGYVDAYFEGRLCEFIGAHGELLKADGSLRSAYLRASEMINRAESDDVFADFMRGEKQVIRTGQIGGIPFKAKFDVYIKGQRIVDLKTVKNMLPVYREGQGRISFADAWHWPLQMAIYQKLEGGSLPCYLAVITKESPPDIEVIHIPQSVLDAEIEILLSKLPYFDAIRSGVVEAERCTRCEYCRSTKKLTGPVDIGRFTEFEGGFE